MKHRGERSTLPGLILTGGRRRRGVGRLAWLVLSVFASLTGITDAGVGGAPPPPLPGLEGRAAAPQLVIDWRSDRLSVSAHAAPWSVVLPELERQTGIRTVVRGALTGTLTQAFEALPLEQGLRRLFRGADTAFLYEGASAGATAGQLTRIWLWPREGRGVEEPQPRPGTGELPSAGPGGAPPSGSMLNGPLTTGAAEGNHEDHLKALTALNHQGDEGDLRQALFDPDQTVQEQALTLLVAGDRQGTIGFLRDMAKTGEPTERVQALALLHERGHADEPTILPILHEALADADSSVKSYAIQALADRGGDEAVEALHTALRDPDPTVRLQVIDHVAPEDQGLALLQEAFADDDATVRSVAAARLEEAMSEGR
jgi:hypothetical protein